MLHVFLSFSSPSSVFSSVVLSSFLCSCLSLPSVFCKSVLYLLLPTPWHKESQRMRYTEESLSFKEASSVSCPCSVFCPSSPPDHLPTRFLLSWVFFISDVCFSFPLEIKSKDQFSMYLLRFAPSSSNVEGTHLLLHCFSCSHFSVVFTS